MKALHLTSNITAERVVEALLQKFRIVDNPHKFALYEKSVKEQGHGKKYLCLIFIISF